MTVCLMSSAVFSNQEKHTQIVYGKVPHELLSRFFFEELKSFIRPGKWHCVPNPQIH